VQWHFAGFVEFAVADDEACLSRIDIGAIERDRFADPQAGRGEQPKQRIGRAPDAARLQAPARGEHRWAVGEGAPTGSLAHAMASAVVIHV
jgi:hypothetical protein